MSRVDTARDMLRSVPIGAAAIFDMCSCGAMIMASFPQETGNTGVITILRDSYEKWRELHKAHREDGDD